MVDNTIDYIAEIGINHNGSFDKARILVEAAANAGATVAKFQTYITSSRAQTTSPVYELLSSCELPFSAFEKLKTFTEDHGMIFSSTPFCTESFNFLASIHTKYIKIASFHLSNQKLLRHILSRAENITKLILSTGLSTPASIQKTCNLARHILGSQHTLEKIIFMHCISQYPVTKIEDFNLVNIPLIRQITDCSVGYSDHTTGHKAAELSIALGARTIEKHFTTDSSQSGADHHMSSTPSEFRILVEACNSVITMLGVERSISKFECELPIHPFNVITDD